MIRANITFLDPKKATWIRIQQFMIAIHACETYIELEFFLDRHKEEIAVEYINLPSDPKEKLPVPHVGFRQLEIRFNPEKSDMPIPR